MSTTFTVTFATGSHKLRSFGFIAQLCEYCEWNAPGASSMSFNGQHWRVLVTSKKYPSDEQALAAAKNLRRPKI